MLGVNASPRQPIPVGRCITPFNWPVRIRSGSISAGHSNLRCERLGGWLRKVAIVAHMFGIPTVLPDKLPITVIEDCAQSLGAEIAGQKVGMRGKIQFIRLLPRK